MAPSNVSQRVETVEQELAGIRASMEQMQAGSVQTQQTFLDEVARMNAQMRLFMEGHNRFQEEVRASLPDFTNIPNTPNSNNSPGGAGGSNWRFKKLDMPLFDGTNPDGWIMRAERYYDFYRLTEAEKVEAAVVAMEGDALFWYQWEHRRRPITQWGELKTLLRRQFRATQEGSLYEQWLAVTQTGTVAEYRKKFIEYSAPLEGVSEEVAMGQFITGLKGEIKAEIRLLGPPNLETAMELAFKVEEKLRHTQPRNSHPRTSQNPNPFFPKNPNPYNPFGPGEALFPTQTYKLPEVQAKTQPLTEPIKEG